jgi:hypothetical protein
MSKICWALNRIRDFVVDGNPANFSRAIAQRFVMSCILGGLVVRIFGFMVI